MRHKYIGSLIVATLLAAIGATATAGEFGGVGDLTGGIYESGVPGVSADGSTVVGYSESASGVEAFRWTSSGGIVGLGDLAGGSFYSEAMGASSDGSVVVGLSASASGTEAFSWTSGGGMTGLGDLAGGVFDSRAYAISSDGLVVVGQSSATLGYEAYRWTSGGGMVGLGDLAGGNYYSQAYGASSDGSVVVGHSSSASGTEAFRWTSGVGMVGLGDLPGSSFSSTANAVSGDGSVVVGYGVSASGTEAFRWTSGGGMVGLGDLAGGSFVSDALATNLDGSVIVGFSTSAAGSDAFIWDATNNMRSLQDILEDDYKFDLTGWTLTSATGVSSDGKVIVGEGTSASGTEVWRVDLSLSDIYWDSSSGTWNTASKWDPEKVPGLADDVYISPSSTATVTGPTTENKVNSLTIGGGVGSATLRTSGGGDLTVTQALTVEANGTLDHEQGTLSADSIDNRGTLQVASAMDVAGAITNDNNLYVYAGGDVTTGSGLTNSSFMSISGGTIGGGTVTNDYGANLNAEGEIDTALDNNGGLYVSGVLVVSGKVTNYGSIDADSGESLRADGGLDNYGTIDLDGGSITGGGALINYAGGVIRGGSAISALFQNTGGLVHADGTSTLVIVTMTTNSSGGEMRINDGAGISVASGFTNQATVVLGGAGAMLSGGAINSSGTIRGQGLVTSNLTNTGAVRAEGGVLSLSGTLGNGSAGLMEVMSGATLYAGQGLAQNDGSVVLRGGTFDNSSYAIDNQGQITGYGVFRSGGLTNSNHVGVGGGDMDVIGDVVNSGTFDVAAGRTATFYNDVSGSGSFGGTGTVVFLGAVNPGSSPAAVSFGGDVVLGSGAKLEIELGGGSPGSGHDALNVAGNLTVDGVLELRLINGFTPSIGQEFEILTFSSLSGEFDGVEGWDLPDRALVAQYDSNGLRLLTTFYGDANLDLAVTDADYTIWANNFDPAASDATWATGDFNGDGAVTDADLSMWSAYYGSATTPGSPVPEPASVILLAAGWVAAMARRRRKQQRS